MHSRRKSITQEAFQAKVTSQQLQRNKEHPGSEVRPLYVGIAIVPNRANELQLGLAVHDGTYCIDFMVQALPSFASTAASEASSEPASKPATPLSTGEATPTLADHIVAKIRDYREVNLAKFMGAGMTELVAKLSPHLPARLWSELDIVAFVFNPGKDEESISMRQTGYISVDEDSAWLARKTVRQFGPNGLPHLMLGYRNQVLVDCETRRGRAFITNAQDYPDTVKERTWQATKYYADSLKKNNISIAFFNSTPQGGGVALMRHALIRFLRLIDVKCKWYVPNPRAGVFRITKNNHNILQGVEPDPTKRLTKDDIAQLNKWVEDEAKAHWTSHGGPLSAREQGGADVIVVDDPQMPSLVKIAKENDPTRPVIFRSHIQVRADLADREGTPTAEIWDWVWENVKDCNVFVSHPVPDFVPKNVTPEKVGYLPASTDWLDGLNKRMASWDTEFYMHVFGRQCITAIQRELDFPNRPYIVQIARFDPAKGIPDVLAAYNELRKVYMKESKVEEIPQLVIAGHGAVDDPDATIIYDEAVAALESDKYKYFKNDVIVMRLGPSDQVLNALMACAHVALQLSTREGFEVKVSEALHMGIPIIATRRGGIPLQVQHNKSGFLVDAGDYKAVAYYLNHLFTNQDAHAQMSEFAAENVSDEVSTVGNALSWLYLADTLSQGHKIEPNSRWINDMAREQANLPYLPYEPRLPRNAKNLTLSRESSAKVLEGA